MLLYPLILLAALHCSAQADTYDNPVSMTMGAAQSAQSDVLPAGPNQTATEDVATPPPGPCVCSPAVDLQPLIQDQLQEAQWRGEVLGLLSQLVSGQKQVAEGQSEEAKLLVTLGTQGAQQIVDLQNLARHQSLLVENHQALLLQTSRIATLLQDIAKKLPSQ